MTERQTETFVSSPEEIVVDSRKETKSFVVSPELQASMPNIFEAFAKVEKPFLDDPEAYLTRLQDSVFSFKSKTGAEVACSLLYDDSSKKDELLLIWAPFSDGAPKTNAEELYNYIIQPLPKGISGLAAKEKAKPNTWNQATKSSVVFELLGAIGSGMPVLTIYSPIPVRAYAEWEKVAFKKYGDFMPAAVIAHQAIKEAQKLLHGISSETQIDKVNLQGASLGASNAIGAARELQNKDITVPTVTAQELIIIPPQRNGLMDFLGVAKRFTIASRVGEASDIEISKATQPRIYEPHIRRKIDEHGSELSLLPRMIKAVKPTYLRGLAHPEQVVRDIERLLHTNVSLLIALAENSNLTHQTREYLPNDREKVITVRGEKGHYADHIIDEHVALTALVAALGVRNK